MALSPAEFAKKARDGDRQLLALHTKLDAVLKPGGFETDVVPINLTKAELALMMATIEMSL